MSILAINGGSSSIRFALYQPGEPPRPLLQGKLDRIGLDRTHLGFSDAAGKSQAGPAIDPADERSTVAWLLDWFETQPAFAAVQAVGHRVVHGMTHSEPERITPQLLDQ